MAYNRGRHETAAAQSLTRERPSKRAACSGPAHAGPMKP
ncbi:hypothetical protein C7S16_2983 [Burkholderia thailandensis]|uniref:Uncharacterized protein n=1 Tax=Burkholderia thailandensis TaxID=57975 RepID=A0AAW9D3D0_BURTH|nr:hypothetical protein [Burkholderia thailandensis]MDW9255281.1 hypothetical protein [Burkholderia thailandensis]